MAAKRKASSATPAYTDYIVRMSKPGTYMRSQVVRALDEQSAMLAATELVAGLWSGWSIQDVLSVAEAKARSGVTGG